MNRDTKRVILLSVLAATSAFAHAQEDAYTKFNNAIASSNSNTVNTYLPNPAQYGAAPSLANATPGTTEGDAAYARNMRIEYAKDALANSTARAEATMRTESAKSPNCQKIVASADTAKKTYVVRHLAPDPTQVIKNSTCFVDIIKIKIPRSGSSIVDGLIGQLADFVSKSQCSATSNYWGNIASAANTGNVSGLSSMAVTAGSSYVAQTVYSAPATAASSAGGGWVTQPGTVVTPGTVTSVSPVATSSAPAATVMDSIVNFLR